MNLHLRRPGPADTLLPPTGAPFAAPVRPRTYHLQCAGCLACAHVTLEAVVPMTGSLRCLACGETKIVVTEALPREI